MENQNNVEPVPAAAENGANAAANAAGQEVTSTTPNAEPTKRSLRVQTWHKIQNNKCGIGFKAIFNRIPAFVDSDKAAALLAETDEFKNAKNVKVNMDRALFAAKLQTVNSGKTLYLPATRDSSAVYLKVDVPEDANEDKKKEILNVQDVTKHRTEINIDNPVKLDLIVIGSVLVSRDGYRIGRGNGFTDLDIGLLIEIGSITPETTIVTMVHDVQVTDNLPTNLFQNYDTPVDLIVTPTEVIRVAKRLARPPGLIWKLLSERRLKLVPALRAVKESQEKAGKVIVLKEEDTDVEAHQNNRSRRRGPYNNRRYGGGRRYQRRAVSQTDNEQQQQQGGDNNTQQRRFQRRPRRFTNNRRRRPTKSEGDQSGAEAKSQERKPYERRQRQQRQKQRPQRDFCVKLTNITRGVRVKDLKVELRKRECNPLFITWKGHFGKCFLHFGNRNGTPSTEEDINKVLQSLNELSLTVPVGTRSGNASGGEGDSSQPQATKTINVNVELVKFDEKRGGAAGADGEAATSGVAVNGDAGGDANGARIESVDTTTV